MNHRTEEQALAVMLHDYRDRQQALAEWPLGPDGQPAIDQIDWSANILTNGRRVHTGRQGKYRYEIVQGDSSIRYVIFEGMVRITSCHGYDDFDEAESAARRWIDINS